MNQKTPAKKTDQKVELSTTEIANALKEQEDFHMQFSVFTKEAEILFLKLLSRMLAYYDKLYLKDPLVTILKELITNATKANLKRLHFFKKDLDINVKSDYISGMETFKEECLKENAPILQELKKSSYKVRIIFSNSGEYPQIKVINNLSIVKEELIKIEARINKAYKYNDITEAFNDVLDDSEGAGLGLIMAMLIFKNVGFSRDNFSIVSNTKITSCTITLPINNLEMSTPRTIAAEILEDLEYLPSFPENITKLSELCDSPDATILEISEYAKTDPSLAASILKRANSVGYLTTNKVNSIEDAIKKIGLAGIKALAIAASVDTIIEDRYPQYKHLWESSYRKAFYAYKIAIQLKNKKIAETVYLAALISKVGEIALLSAKQISVERINKIAGLKNLTNTDLLQEMTLGISHPTLSAMITKKWNFDKKLTASIKYHLRPHLAPSNITELVYIIYLSHVLNEYENNKSLFQSLDFDVLKFFSLQKESEFIKLHSILKQAYNTGN